jgi:hypothetical protein
MAAAIGGGDVSWGMGPDVEGDGDEGSAHVDWRKWVAKNTPTEKQQKLLDKIRCARAWAQARARTAANRGPAFVARPARLPARPPARRAECKRLRPWNRPS